MKKFLPKILLVSVFLLTTLCIASFAYNLHLTAARPVYAADPAPISQQSIDNIGPNEPWQPDAEVTFTGKLAARSQATLDWLLQNYQWAILQPDKGDVFAPLWQFVVGVVGAVMVLFILAGAFLMIITRGRSITVRRFIPRFIFIVILVVLSYSIVRTIYQLTDIVQGFFVNRTAADGTIKTIQSSNLLSVAFKYQDFLGFRKIGDSFNESAVISLLLIKLTAATYYTMFIILIIRKIILWFFILVSPVFPLLLFFKPLRNTAKIWIGEMFKWVLYAPLFAIFLRGLVEIWEKYVPLGFKPEIFTGGTPLPDANTPAYFPTAINILLGGPKIIVQGSTGINNVNVTDSFVLYVVALMMLWMVIIMPWILLRIFLDYFNDVTSEDSGLIKYLAGPNSPLSPLTNRFRSPQGSPPPGSPPGSGSTGLAKNIPLMRFKHSPVEVQNEIAARVQNQIGKNIAQGVNQSFSSGSLAGVMAGRNFQTASLQASAADIQILGEANLTIPTMRDIAKYETAMMSGQSPAREEVNRLNEMLSRLAGSSQLASPAEKQKFVAIRERITQQAKGGNAIAKSVSDAAAPGGAAIPESNAIQQVNLDDYEEIKKTWQQNYRTLEPPQGPDNKSIERKEWLKQEVAKIPQVIDLLLSGDPAQVERGKQMVSNILPFLLLGGFSKAEIIGYLKAKFEAAKQVLGEVIASDTKKEEEENMVDVSNKKEAENTMTMSAQAPLPDDSTNPNQNPASDQSPQAYANQPKPNPSGENPPGNVSENLPENPSDPKLS